ncbi:MAG: DUF6062 family protein [Treponema sp.]|jgi:hypothetical protein|nr:DUF6062 family protein [Treponema sp.]
MMDKHINFIELEKACAKPGCPLCTIISERAERYIDGMLFEHVSDRVFRKEFREAGGFCSFHSQKLDSFRDGLAVAILSRDILEDRIAGFNKRLSPLKPRKPKGRCPVCVERERIEKEYLTFLLQADGGENGNAARDFFTASEGFCAPHYAKLLEIPKLIPKWIITFHENKFEELMRRTSQFIELSAYGRGAEFARLSEKDKLVWKEIARNLRGGD